MSLGRLVQLSARIAGIVIIVVGVAHSLRTESAFVKGEVLHVPSLLFVFSILVGVTFFAYPLGVLGKTLRKTWGALVEERESESTQMDSHLESLSEAYYRGGATELRRVAVELKLPKLFFTVVNQLEAKIPEKDIRILIEEDLRRFESDYARSIDYFSGQAAISPSVGLLGTVLGLIKLLSDLQDFGALGGHMALALLTALYGIFLNVILFNPVAAALEAHRDSKVKAYERVLFWLYLIEHRKPAFFSDPKYLTGIG